MFCVAIVHTNLYNCISVSMLSHIFTGFPLKGVLICYSLQVPFFTNHKYIFEVNSDSKHMNSNHLTTMAVVLQVLNAIRFNCTE